MLMRAFFSLLVLLGFLSTLAITAEAGPAMPGAHPPTAQTRIVGD